MWHYVFTVNLKQYFNTEFVPLRFIINVGAYVSSHAKKKCRLVAQLFLPEYIPDLSIAQQDVALVKV